MRLDIDSVATEFPLTATSTRDHLSESTAWDYESVLRKGIAAAQDGDRDGARKLLSRVTALNPSSEDAWMWLASISDYPEELLAFLNRVLDINPANDRAVEWRTQTNALLAKTFVQRALAARNDGSLDLARQYIVQALAHDDKCESALYWKAAMTEDEDEQLELFSALLAINSDHAEAALAVENIHRDRIRRSFDQAKEHLDRGDNAAARAELTHLVSHQDLEVRVRSMHMMAGASDDDEERLDWYSRILEIHPEDGAATDALTKHAESKVSSAFAEARAAAAAGSSDEALTMLRDLLDQVPDSVEAWLLYSHLSPGLNEKIDALNRVLQIDPANGAARSGLEYLEQTFGASAPTAQPAASPVVEAELPPREVEEPVGDLDDDGPSEYAHHYLSDSAEFALRRTEEALHVSEEPIFVDTGLEPEAVRFASDDDGVDPADSVSGGDTEPLTYSSPFDTKAEDEPDHRPVGATCPFCSAGVDAQAFFCGDCNCMLTLADIERLLSGVSVNREAVQDAVTAMEAEWNYREFTEEELVTLGVGHMNLGNFDSAFRYLQEAARMNPNDVILSGHINTLAIRLEEMRRQNETLEAMPKGKTILVVDDSPTVRKLIAGKLEKTGHNVVCAVDGVDALERLAEQMPDLVLLDITMPRMDGYEVCKQIRANPAAKDLPVVMISGKDGFFDKVRGRMAGTTGYVTKPFGPETLMKALETYLLPDMAEVEQ